MKSSRGIIAVAYLLAGAIILCVALWPNWHIPAFLQRKPQTRQLSQAEVDLQAAKAQLATAQAKLDAAESAKQKATLTQAQYAQQMVAGVPVALALAPQSPEVVLASQLANRASIGLAAAIGALPADKQAEIEAIVGQALSAKQAEIDRANAALKAMDAELAATTASKMRLEASLPPLQATLDEAKAQVGAKDALVAEKTQEVAQYADQHAADDAKAGSLEAYAANLLKILVIAAIVYIVVHLVLPSLASEFSGSSWLRAVYLFMTSIFSAHSVIVQRSASSTQTTTK